MEIRGLVATIFEFCELFHHTRVPYRLCKSLLQTTHGPQQSPDVTFCNLYQVRRNRTGRRSISSLGLRLGRPRTLKGLMHSPQTISVAVLSL
eukprot:4032752-Pleurochrysis_carterae.AAC.1